MSKKTAGNSTRGVPGKTQTTGLEHHKSKNPVKKSGQPPVDLASKGNKKSSGYGGAPNKNPVRHGGRELPGAGNPRGYSSGSEVPVPIEDVSANKRTNL